MATIIYLDPEDEITSAAARIRSARETRVVLVLPFGSRLATSRINFRLLAREAESMGRRLDIVAPDAAARSIAASAGLTAYASVNELDDAEEGAAGAGAAATTATTQTAPGLRSSGGSGVRSHGARPVADSDEASSVEGSADAPKAGGFLGLGGIPTRSGVGGGRGRGEPMVSSPSRRAGFRPSRLAAIGIVVLIVAGAGYAGWTILPAADITITPRVSPVGPVIVVVHADPAASTVDPSGGVIPATTISVPASVSGDFKATGKRVDETKASGQVRFDSINTLFDVAIPAGTRVSTLDGIVFATTAAVKVPQATVSGTTIKHGSATVGISAAKAGTASNVAADTITQVSATLLTEKVSVSNAAPTTGGTHTETPVVAQADVDGAMSTLGKQLATAFSAAIATPAGVPAGATVFPATATSSEPIPDPQPATLVGKEVASFSLQLSVSGSMLAVDASPVQAIAEARLKSAIHPEHALVAGSVHITVGDGTVLEGVVSFAAQATASEILILDPAVLRRNVLGLSKAEAEAMLGQYGEVSLGLWPDWVGAVPGMDSRVTLTVVGADGSKAPPSASPSASPGASPGS